MKTAAICYALHERVLVLKLVGAVRIGSCEANRLTAALEAFIRHLSTWRDVDQLLIDLTETEAIDSTYLGLLAQAAQCSQAQWQRSPVILSPNENINAVLESVSFDQVFTIVRQSSGWEGSLQPLPEAGGAETGQIRLVLAAHQALARINRANAEQFRNVIELVDEELRAGEPPGRN